MEKCARRLLSASLAALVLTSFATGCSRLRGSQPKYPCECERCPDGVCPPAEAGVRGCQDVPRRGHRYSKEWFCNEAQRPVGARQKLVGGKLYPPQPRPVGEQQTFGHMYHANHYWPWPYVCKDRAYVRDLTALQVNAGWTSETTLYDYHFDPETNLLNHSGQEHLRWILTSAPIEHRVIHVQKTWQPAVTDGRMVNVRNATVQLVGGEEIPPIVARLTAPLGRPAEEVDLIRQRELATMPDPRIQFQSLSGGAAAGGGAGAQ